MTSLPGIPIGFGFEFDKTGDDMRLSPEAQQRVNDKIDSVNAALRAAMASAHSYVVD